MIEVPSYVSKQNPITIRKYVAIQRKAGNGVVGKLVADKWLKNQMSMACNRKNCVTSVKFNVVEDGKQLIKRASNGDEYVDFVMADNKEDSDGLTIQTEVLEQWAEEINNGKVLVGDIDHEEYDYVTSNIANPDEAASILSKMKKGIAKTVKAYVEKGKLFVRAIIDKRYRKMVEKFKGVSLEAFLDTIKTATGKIAKGGDLLGFTFALKNKPVNSRAVIL